MTNVINWDDLKYFLHVSRKGSVRSAANALNVNHTTVARRLKQFEKSLGSQLLIRTAKGYSLTKTGEELLNEAVNIEQRLTEIERRIVGQDQLLAGEVKIACSELVAQHLLMPGISKFAKQFPDISLTVIETNQLPNLDNREADIAFYLCNQPPLHLIGRKLAQVHYADYISNNYTHRLQDTSWLKRQPVIIEPTESEYNQSPLSSLLTPLKTHHFRSTSLKTQACIEGMGLCNLPCFYGDRVAQLTRVPPYNSYHTADLWLLSHTDLRNSEKIRAFTRFISLYISDKVKLIEGRDYVNPPATSTG